MHESMQCSPGSHYFTNNFNTNAPNFQIIVKPIDNPKTHR